MRRVRIRAAPMPMSAAFATSSATLQLGSARLADEELEQNSYIRTESKAKRRNSFGRERGEKRMSQKRASRGRARVQVKSGLGSARHRTFEYTRIVLEHEQYTYTKPISTSRIAALLICVIQQNKRAAQLRGEERGRQTCGLRRQERNALRMIRTPVRVRRCSTLTKS